MEAGEILFRRGLLDDQQLQQVRREQNGEGPLWTAVRLGYVREDAALRAIAEAIGIPYLDTSETEPDVGLLADFPARFIHRDGLFPVRRDAQSLTIATSDPFDLYALDEVSAAMGLPISPVLTPRQEIATWIKRHLGVGSETVEGLLGQSDDAPIQLLDDIETDGSELAELAQEASVIRLVNEILLEAVAARASDVHIESQAHGLAIRYRVDGMLQLQPLPPEIHRFQAAILSRLKIMARLNIAEKRLPQDGRMKLRVANREVDVRVSVIPMLHGEGIVMRILDKSSIVFELRQLGMGPTIYERFLELIQMPHGIVLVTGPTGSGKTTTLYSALLEIRRPEVNIITCEDPVEYQLEGINQIQVHPKIGLTFAHSLRSILRHDPDVILVGEIRDLETAENAIQASLTGHLVFSTLHTNDAASAYARLMDMGVESFLVSSTVEAVMAQRLVRTLCEHCKRAQQPARSDLPEDFPHTRAHEMGVPCFIPVGCRQCRHTGYAGRMGIYELLPSSNAIRTLAHDRANTWDLARAALQEGMVTLRQDGWEKVLQGRTSVEEVVRVTKGDRVLNHD